MPANRRLSNYKGPACPVCNAAVAWDRMTDGPQECVVCARTFEARVFRPPQRTSRVLQLAQSGPEGASSCANHARNAAVAACERCGLFICSLCEIDIDQAKYCPSCFERLSKDGGSEAGKHRIRDYGSMCVISALLGIFLSPLGVLFGLLSFYYAYKATRKDSESGMSTLGIVLALFVAVIDVVVGAFVLTIMLFPHLLK